MLWTAVHYSVFMIFPLHSQKMWQKIHQINQENKEKIDCTGVYLPNSAPKTADISQLSKPKHRFRYIQMRPSFIHKKVFTNMWIWFTFLKRVWSWIFVLKFTFLPLFLANVRWHFGCWLRKFIGSSFQRVVHHHFFFFFFWSMKFPWVNWILLLHIDNLGVNL